MGKYTSVDEYIDSFEGAQQERLQTIRALFHKLVPDVTESISYDIPAFKVGNERLYMSSYKEHTGMYPMYGLPELEQELKPFRGKGTKDSLHFKHSDPLPKALIEKIILAKAHK